MNAARKRYRWISILALPLAFGAAVTVSISAHPIGVRLPVQGPAAAGNKTDAAIEFIKIASGQFQMGCSTGAKPNECDADEKPQHPVVISKAFEIGKTEVTQSQWQAVMGTNPSSFKGANLPVEQVSWSDAQEFLKKLNDRKDGYHYRLPTEAEWEYAARAGSSDQYSGSLDDMAWHSGNSEGRTHSVAQKQPNAWGLYDMRGNVSEWVQDWYDKAYYANSAEKDPAGPASGTFRSLRGGSFHVYPWLTRVSVRSQFDDTYKFFDSGLRVVREPQ